ncbi:SUR7/PalI family-domain-containing protein [Flagelloscypha sp. PMI_526]|nr:SUR7/PalI family-domain-containing protein [Flagelloscypha sp. PMI_526]
MGCLRPATPGFLVTLVATILLAVVTFCVPYFKSVYFLKATFTQSGKTGSITLGTLGYCVDISGSITCSKPSVGYQIDITGLIGNLPFNIDIPDIVTKWLTYALVLHPVALVLACGSSLFGLLAHVREMSMACCSTCVSGFAAGVALLAFIFDVVLFFLAKSAINTKGSAEMGNALWLTLAAWVMLFFSGCFYTLGRCCINKRGPRDHKKKKDHESGHGGPDFSEQLRLDAVKAEADRKNRTKLQEGGLPAFYEHQPLTGHIDGNDVYIDDPNDHKAHSPTYGGHSVATGGYAGGGYVQGHPGDRAVDEYYHPSQTTYPPAPSGPRRQASAHSYAPSTYTAHTTSPPPMPAVPAQTNYLSPGHEYGHTSGGTTYHSAVSHGSEPSGYSPYEAYENNPYQNQTPYATPYSDPFAANRMASPPMPTATPPGIAPPLGYYPSNHSSPAPERSYTLGGDGYGGNSVPPLPDTNPYAGHDANPYAGGYATSQPSMDFANAYPQSTPSPAAGPSGVQGPRPHRDSQSYPEQPPPMYSEEHGAATGAWGKQ